MCRVFFLFVCLFIYLFVSFWSFFCENSSTNFFNVTMEKSIECLHRSLSWGSLLGRYRHKSLKQVVKRSPTGVNVTRTGRSGVTIETEILIPSKCSIPRSKHFYWLWVQSINISPFAALPRQRISFHLSGKFSKYTKITKKRFKIWRHRRRDDKTHFLLGIIVITNEEDKREIDF